MSYIAKNGRLYTSGASEALTLLDDKFSVNKSYSKGDSCIYNDYLWKFTSDKPAGEWDSSVVEQCRIMDFVDDINTRLSNKIKYVDVVMNIPASTWVSVSLPSGITARNVLRIEVIPHNNTNGYFNVFSSAGSGEEDTSSIRLLRLNSSGTSLSIIDSAYSNATVRVWYYT